MTILFVGQAPSSTAGHRRAFEGASGRRLARLIGVSYEELLARARTKNLLPHFPGKAGEGGRGGTGDAFPMREARRRAARFDVGDASYVILCGTRLAKAFGIGYVAPFSPFFFATGRGVHGAVIPHPSGVSRWWNCPVNELRAARFLREAWATYAAPFAFVATYGYPMPGSVSTPAGNLAERVFEPCGHPVEFAESWR